MRRTVACLVLAAAAAGCSNGSDDARWTVERAEGIRTIRGMKVHVLSCRELRAGRRFACQAGARRPGEAYDSVGIHYDIRVTARDRYVLENVRFIGGPGIP